MAIKIIKNNLVDLNSGESSVLRKLKMLYDNETTSDNVFVYVQPNISNCRPDFVVIDNRRGIAVIEVKDWSAEYIHGFNEEKVVLSDRQEDNPIAQLNDYYTIINGLTRYGLKGVKDGSKYKNIVHGKLIFTNLKSQIIRDKNYEIYLEDKELKYITAERYKHLDLKDVFDDANISIDGGMVDKLRVIMFPEIQIKDSCNIRDDNKDIKALDNEQEEFARRIPYGHYMVSGVPGSGKTVILRARAVQLVKEHPEWDILVLSYNKSLVNEIKKYFVEFQREADKNPFQHISTHKIQVKTFHKFALDISNERVPANAPNEWWTTTLPDIAFTRAVPQYDAILIDEYQDFYENWIRLCVKCCKKYKDESGADNEVQNIFFAGDRLQSIYNPNEVTWSSLGINMRGRSKLLKTSYRSIDKSMKSALKLLEEVKELKKEVEKFYKDEDEEEVEIESLHQGKIEYIEGNYRAVADKIEDLVENQHYKYEDILVLCKTRRISEYVKNMLAPKYQDIAEIMVNAKELPENKLIITTYYSAKGLEARVAILVDGDKFTLCDDKNTEMKQRKLFYVGMTRASERLYIHAQNFETESYANEVRYKF